MLNFEFDIAISLCKQDVDFAKKLVSNINPGLKVFFYENNQEHIISKSGPEVFGKIFKEKSRVVVILSRDEWSDSYYTDIERNAIIDRTSVKNQGYNFLMVIPMIPGQIPSWYPSTRIYTDPRKFSIEQIARFIEFKVTDEGGEVKPVTLEERYKQLNRNYLEKERIVLLQVKPEAIEAGKVEIESLKSIFNAKIKVLEHPLLGETSHFLFSGHISNAKFSINDFQLTCSIENPDNEGVRVVTTQDFFVIIKLRQLFGQDNSEKVLSERKLLFYYTEYLQGWATPFTHSQTTQHEIPVLFKSRDSQMRYELTKPISSAELVDAHFQLLLKYASERISKYL
jgi:hypothetical protein